MAKRLGGKTVKGSGSGFDKGDVRLKGVMLLECKCTEKDSFRLTRDMVRKLEDAACSSGEVPVLQVEFIGQGKTQRLLVMPDYALDLLLGKK